MRELYRYRKLIAVYGITAFILSAFLWIGYKNGNIEKLELAYYDLSFKIKNCAPFVYMAGPSLYTAKKKVQVFHGVPNLLRCV